MSVIHGHVLDVLRTLEPESVQTVVTSPPYWGLRDYGLPPQVWDGDPACEHEWGESVVQRSAGYDANSKTRWNHQVNGRGEVQEDKADRARWTRKEFSQGAFCQGCGAWLGSLGLEPDYRLYVEHMVAVFAGVWRVLRADGTLWLNLGDCWATGGGSVGHAPGGGKQGETFKEACGHRPEREELRRGDDYKAYRPVTQGWTQPNRMPQPDLKPKDLVGIPWRVAFALQDAGWYLRSDIIWSKPNPMPESVTDRPTKAHEYLFLLSKCPRYYYDAEAIKEFASPNTHARIAQRTLDSQKGGPKQRAYEDGTAGRQRQDRSAGQIAKALRDKQIEEELARTRGAGRCNDFSARWAEGERSGGLYDKQAGHGRRREGFNERYFGREPGVNPKAAESAPGSKQNASWSAAVGLPVLLVNKRSVWTISTKPFADAHFATFPPELVEPCVLAGSRPGDMVLDPFAGSGTVGVVAKAFGREFVGVELNPNYIQMAERRIFAQNPALPFEAVS